MQAIFRHLGAAFICTAVVYLGGVSAGLFAAAVTGAAISIVITIFGESLKAAPAVVAHQQGNYNGNFHQRNAQTQAEYDPLPGTVRLLKIALVSAICGLSAVKSTWFMILDMDYSFRGTPWWAFLFYIVSAITAYVVVSSREMRRIVFGRCPDRECERMTHAVCHILALAGLLSLAFNLTSATIVASWLVLPASVLLSLTISYPAIADGAAAGLSFSRQRYNLLRRRFWPQVAQKPADPRRGDWS